jgi:ribosomal protein S18 acetylase RimI-like enzyme
MPLVVKTPAITLRSLARGDVDAVLALWGRSDVAGSQPDTPAALLGFLAHDPELFVVAENEAGIVGTLIGGWDGWRGNMYRLAVDPAHRRRGIARALVREVEVRMRARGARRVTALVLYDHDWATAFWTAVGYPVDETIQRHVRNV